VDLLGFVYVEVATLPDFAEGLYADGEFFHGTGECFDKNREYSITSRRKLFWYAWVYTSCCLLVMDRHFAR